MDTISRLRVYLANWILGQRLNAYISKGQEKLTLRRLRHYGYDVPDDYQERTHAFTVDGDMTYAEAVEEANKIVRGNSDANRTG